jgi:hypothetical protein
LTQASSFPAKQDLILFYFREPQQIAAAGKIPHLEIALRHAADGEEHPLKNSRRLMSIPQVSAYR